MDNIKASELARKYSLKPRTVHKFVERHRKGKWFQTGSRRPRCHDDFSYAKAQENVMDAVLLDGGIQKFIFDIVVTEYLNIYQRRRSIAFALLANDGISPEMARASRYWYAERLRDEDVLPHALGLNALDPEEENLIIFA